MDLKYVTPDLRRLDLFVGEVLVVPIATDERPPRGAAGLLDYRLAGEISRLLATKAFTGALGQSHVLRPRPRLLFDRLLLIGVGDRAAFNPQVYAGVLEQLIHILSEAGSRRAVIELPGRKHDLIEPELAIDILLERLVDHPLFDTWTIIDKPEAIRKVSAQNRRDPKSRWGSGSTS